VNDPLILVRAIHFVATIMASGALLFAAFVAEPAFRRAGHDGSLAAGVRTRLMRMVWISLAVVAISGLAWLILVTQDISDRKLAGVFSDGVIWVVLGQTGFGQVWLVRCALAGILAGMLLRMPPGRQIDSYRMGIAAAAAGLVGTLAWAGHAAGTSGIEGMVHLTADVLHLVSAAVWVGALLPLALLLGAASRNGDETSVAIARSAVLRFSLLGVGSVATLLLTGIVNSWILVGSVPALVGTDYGHLLLVKIALFLVMVAIATVNRFRLRPRLVQEPGIVATHGLLAQLARNSAIEAILGAFILVIVAVLGTIPPGLHQQASWPFSVRVSPAVFGDPDLYFAIAFGAACIVTGIVVRQFRWPAIVVGIAIYLLVGFRLPTEEAFPTTFYASPTGFSAQSIAQGARLFAAHCATCHGPEGRGDGPAGASLTTKPADLTADHVYEHTDGDLFWWITHGIDPAMPGFAAVLDEEARWSLSDYIRANADAIRLRAVAGGTIAAFPAPDFSVTCQDGATAPIGQFRPQALHILVAAAGAEDWLRRVADRDGAGKLRTIIIGSRPDGAKGLPLCATRDPDTLKTFALYGGDPERIEGTEFLVDRDGNLRSMWRTDAADDASALQRRVQGLRTAARVRRPSGLQGHTHTH
jgi:putative copper export protein/mono/diheme cytochrome c family protein